MFVKIDHVGIAVRNLAAGARLYSERLGMPVHSIQTLAADGVRAAFLGGGETRIELLEPSGDGGPVARFLERRGEGLHHVGFEVDDLGAEMARLLGAGIRMMGRGPRPGADGCPMAFLDPKESGGVLIEILESRTRSAEKIAPGQTVLVYLQNPKERFWGILREIAVFGVTVEGIELSSFDAWIASATKEGEDEAMAAAATTALFPSHRIERVLLDRPSAGAESLEERFRSRVGSSLAEYLSRSR